MPARPIQTNFTSGELTELLDGRVDLRQYANGAHCLKNFVPRSHGGASRRAGTIFIAPTKFQDAVAHLQRFEFGRTQAYVIEMGNLYFRFYANRALLRAASTSPALTLTLSALTGYTVTATASGAYFTNTATDLGREITFASGGRARIRSVTSTTVATVFVLEDFTALSATSGNWTITGAPVEVVTPYVTADIPSLKTEQSADVMYIAHTGYAPRKLQRVTATSFVLSVINFRPPPTFQGGHAFATTITLGALTGLGITVEAGAVGTFLAADVGRQITSGVGRLIIKTVIDSDSATGDVVDDFTGLVLASGDWVLEGTPVTTLQVDKKEPLGANITLTLGAAGWRTTADVGKYVKVFGGVVKLTGFTSTTIASGEIQKTLDDAGTTFPATAPAGAWTLEEAAWSASRGYPGAVGLADGRLWWGGSPTQPDTLWGSVVGDYENHGTGVGDSDAVEVPSGSSGVNQIVWIKKGKVLAFGTIGSENTLTGGGADEPITPTGPPQIKEQSTYGSDATVDALKVGQAVIFLQRGGRRLRELAYNFEADGYVAPDLALLAEHLLRDAVTRMAHVQSPDSVILAVAGNGELLSLSYERSELIVAWAHHVTGRAQNLEDGRFESVAVIPNNCGSGDEAWVIVRRVINGVTVRYVEVLDGALNVDAGLSYAGPLAAEFRGLEHLEGETVKVVISNTTVYTLVVTNGTITLPAYVTSAQVGLLFIAHLTTLRPEIPTQQGSAQARKKRWNQVWMRLLCTYGRPTVTVSATGAGGERVRYDVGRATDPYTGDVQLSPPGAGWQSDSRITIEQPTPQPCTVLAIGGSLDVDDG